MMQAIAWHVQLGGVAYATHVDGFAYGLITDRPFERFLRTSETET